MKNLAFILIVAFSCISLKSNSQEFGHFGVGVQQGMWMHWGPSVIIDIHRRIGFESIITYDYFSNTNSNIGLFERLILRPIIYKSNSLYLAPSLGTARWHYMGPYNGNYVEAYEWGLHWGVLGGAELDFRLLFPKCIPLFANIEGGIEHRETKYTTSNTYPTFGFGMHYRF